MIASFFVNGTAHIWTMQDKNGCLPDSNYSEIELSFLSKEISFLPKQVQLFLTSTDAYRREAPTFAERNKQGPNIRDIRDPVPRGEPRRVEVSVPQVAPIFAELNGARSTARESTTFAFRRTTPALRAGPVTSPLRATMTQPKPKHRKPVTHPNLNDCANFPLPLVVCLWKIRMT
jgi:hypothetical protein